MITALTLNRSTGYFERYERRRRI